MFDKLVIGSAQFGLNYGISGGNQVSKDEVARILNHSLKNNINYIDTAINYGDCHKVLGDINIEKFQIITKLPIVPLDSSDVTEKFIISAIQNSLNELKVNNIHGVLLHNPLQLLTKGGENILNTLNKLKTRGIIEKIGISIYETSELDSLIPKFEIDIVQSPFNILDQRLINSGWMNKLSDLGVEIHIRSIFLQGLLLMKDKPSKFNKWNDVWESWNEFVINNKTSPMEACLSYVNSFSQVNKIIIGIDSFKQFQEILNVNLNLNFNFNNFKLKIHHEDLLLNPSKWNQL